MIDVETFAIAKKYTDKKVGSSSSSTTSTSNYNDLKNKPSINGKELTGNLSSDEIGVSSKDHNHDKNMLLRTQNTLILIKRYLIQLQKKK